MAVARSWVDDQRMVTKEQVCLDAVRRREARDGRAGAARGASARSRKGLRLLHRRQTVFWRSLLLFGVALCLTVALGALAAKVLLPGVKPAAATSLEGAPPAYTEITVEPGDTLWSLARRYGEPGQSMARRVRLLQHVNGMAGSFLRAGSVVKVPAPAAQ